MERSLGVYVELLGGVSDDGRFHFEGLEAGEYAVDVDHRDLGRFPLETISLHGSREHDLTFKVPTDR